MTLDACRRAQGVFLLTLLFFGGPGVLGVDGLLYHRAAGADSQRATLHVEAAGANCHAEQCLIGRSALTQRYAPRSSVGLPVAAAPSPQSLAPMVTVVRTGERPHLNLPRSPPVPR